MKPFWLWRSHAIPAQEIGFHTITPFVQSIGLRWPGGGWLWQFPLAIEVEDVEDGTHRRLSVPDPTRTVVWFLYALALAIFFIACLDLWRNRRRTLQERMRG